MTIQVVQTKCTAIYNALSGYLTQAASGTSHQFFEVNASTISANVIELTRDLLKTAVDAAASTPVDAPEIWDLVTTCNAAVQDCLSLIEAKNLTTKFPGTVPSTNTLRWLINTTTKR